MDIVANVNRIPTPGETISGTDLHHFPGGKGANQAIAAAQSGATVEIVSAVGNDSSGTFLCDFLASKNVLTTNVSHVDSQPTGTALIAVDQSGENSIIVIPGANGTVTKDALRNCSLSKEDVVVANLEIPLEAVQGIFEDAKKHGALTIFNPAPMLDIDTALLEMVGVLVVNETELAQLTGGTIGSESSVDEIQEAILKVYEAGFSGECAVTLGERGVIARSNSQWFIVQGRATHAVDTTGAGDCFVGVLASSISQGYDFESAIKRANVAASLSVEKPGAGSSMPTIQEIDDAM